LESLKRYIKIEINNLENHPENLESLKEAVGGDTNKVL
jgi:hypothetical protein